MTAEEAIGNIVAYAYYVDKQPPEQVTKAFDVALDALRSQRHGRWEKTDCLDGPKYKCSLCGALEDDVQSHGKYCYNCGAKMEGEGWTEQ